MARERKFSTEDLFKTVKQIANEQGYQGVNFSILAEKLDVARGTLYKYYQNREELITEYMIYEMNRFLEDLKGIKYQKGFLSQLDFLLDIMFFRHHQVQQSLGMMHQVPESSSEKIKANLKKLEEQHIDMYRYLQGFIRLGKEEGRLKSHLADNLILGFIFQSIAIPNHTRVPHSEWVSSIKEILSYGILKSN